MTAATEQVLAREMPWCPLEGPLAVTELCPGRQPEAALNSRSRAAGTRSLGGCVGSPGAVAGH